MTSNAFRNFSWASKVEFHFETNKVNQQKNTTNIIYSRRPPKMVLQGPFCKMYRRPPNDNIMSISFLSSGSESLGAFVARVQP